jgi:hypothetical protein
MNSGFGLRVWGSRSVEIKGVGRAELGYKDWIDLSPLHCR